MFITSLRRTAETAQPLIEATNLMPTIIADLSEVRLGEWEGGELRVRTAKGDPLVGLWLSSSSAGTSSPAPSPPREFAERVRTGLLPRSSQLTGPGARRRRRRARRRDRRAPRARRPAAPRLAFVHAEKHPSISRLIVFGDGRWLLRSFNDTAHLTTST